MLELNKISFGLFKLEETLPPQRQLADGTLVPLEKDDAHMLQRLLKDNFFHLEGRTLVLSEQARTNEVAYQIKEVIYQPINELNLRVLHHVPDSYPLYTMRIDVNNLYLFKDFTYHDALCTLFGDVPDNESFVWKVSDIIPLKGAKAYQSTDMQGPAFDEIVLTPGILRTKVSACLSEYWKILLLARTRIAAEVKGYGMMENFDKCIPYGSHVPCIHVKVPYFAAVDKLTYDYPKLLVCCCSDSCKPSPRLTDNRLTVDSVVNGWGPYLGYKAKPNKVFQQAYEGFMECKLLTDTEIRGITYNSHWRADMRRYAVSWLDEFEEALGSIDNNVLEFARQLEYYRERKNFYTSLWVLPYLISPHLALYHKVDSLNPYLIELFFQMSDAELHAFVAKYNHIEDEEHITATNWSGSTSLPEERVSLFPLLDGILDLCRADSKLGTVMPHKKIEFPQEALNTFITSFAKVRP